ncbi:hypothetical protein ACQPZJ_32055 [Actinoplanes sp. CA-054009]
MTTDDHRRARRARARAEEEFDRMADLADDLADTAEESARVHDQMPGGADHAALDRRFAAAERDAADAYRAHEVPSDDVRDTIRAIHPKE